MDAAAETTPTDTPAKKPVIMCVDDDRIVLTMARAALTRAGFEVVTAPSGEAALETVGDARPDLILLDVMMEGLDGYETCARLHKLPELSYTPVIFATSREGDEDRSRAFAVGAVDYLVKPIKADVLLEKVRQHLRTRDSWQELRTQANAGGGWGFSAQEFARFKESLGRVGSLSAVQHQQLAALKPQQVYEAAQILGVGEDRIARQIAHVLHLPYVSTIDAAHVALGVLPPPFCRTNQVVAFDETEAGYAFVLSNPFNRELIQMLRQWKGGQADALKVAVTEPARVLALLQDGDDGMVVVETLETTAASIDIPGFGSNAEYDEHVTEDSPPIVRLANQLIENAHALGASDIHVEPLEKDVVVRYRIDGALRVVHRFPGNVTRPLASRLKVMSELDIVERRLPQDGRLMFRRFSHKGLDFDLRVATAPMQFGEKIVMRILDKKKAVLPLASLGFSKRNLDRYRSKLTSPDGMILHVGPTGSGKSMTLYAALNEVKRPDINVQTAEDPIEYTLPGINQMQMHPEIGLTFARALRSFLRLDPDVILVGEVRDRETAQIAVEATLTGHLLLSTLHTKDAVSTVMRLVEMGIEPFLVSTSLLIVCAQRLLRRLCPQCREPYEASAEEKRLVGLPADRPCKLYRPKGCPACHKIGFRGRIGTHEVFIPDDALRREMGKPGVTAEALKYMAVRDAAMTTLYWDAMEKVRNGTCGLHDALRREMGKPGVTAEALKYMAVRDAAMTTLYWDAMEKVRAGICGLHDVLGEVRADEFDARPEWMFTELDLPPRAPEHRRD